MTPDCDGSMCAIQLKKYIERINPKCKMRYLIVEDKRHGFAPVIDRVKDADFLIMADGGSSDYEYHKIVKDRGIDCLVIDHHHAEKFSEDAVVINNQLSSISESLCGAGMVYKFLKEVDNVTGNNFSDGLEGYMAIGQVADMMDLSDLESSYYVQLGLDSDNIGLVNMIKEEKRIEELCPVDIAFYISPLINCVHRTGTRKDKINLFKALCLEEDFDINIVRSVKKRQDRMVAEFLNEFDWDVQEFDSLVILSVEDKDYISGIGGLVANKLMSKFKKPTLVFNEDTLKGSMRAPYNEDDGIDFREILEGSSEIEWSRGHASASGVCLKKGYDAEKLSKYISEHCSEKISQVDFIIDFKDLDRNMIEDICELDRFYGKGVESPSVLIKNIPKDIIEFEMNRFTGYDIDSGCHFVKFFAKQDDFKEINSYPYFHAICNANINDFFSRKWQWIIKEWSLNVDIV